MCISLDYSWLWILDYMTLHCPTLHYIDTGMFIHCLTLHDTTLPYTTYMNEHDNRVKSLEFSGHVKGTFASRRAARKDLSRKLGTPIMNGHEPLWHIVTYCDKYIPTETFGGKRDRPRWFYCFIMVHSKQGHSIGVLVHPQVVKIYRHHGSQTWSKKMG